MSAPVLPLIAAGVVAIRLARPDRRDAPGQILRRPAAGSDLRVAFDWRST